MSILLLQFSNISSVVLENRPDGPDPYADICNKKAMKMCTMKFLLQILFT